MPTTPFIPRTEADSATGKVYTSNPNTFMVAEGPCSKSMNTISRTRDKCWGTFAVSDLDRYSAGDKTFHCVENYDIVSIRALPTTSQPQSQRTTGDLKLCKR